MSQPSKEYQARIRVKLSDDILPSPVLSKADLEARLAEHLNVGDPDSPILSLTVDDPADKKSRRRY